MTEDSGESESERLSRGALYTETGERRGRDPAAACKSRAEMVVLGLNKRRETVSLLRT